MMSLIKAFWTKSISRQLMLGIALVHAVLMTFFVIDLVNREKEFLLDLSRKQAIGLSETLAANGSSWMLSQDFIGIEEIINSQSGFPGLQYTMFVDTRGKVIGYTDRHQVGKFLNDKISKTLISAKPKTFALIDNSWHIDIAAPIVSMNNHIGWARVGISRQGISQNLKQVTESGLAYTLFAIIMGTIFAWFMSRSLTVDIRQLVSRANRLQAGETDINFKINRGDELGELADNFQALNMTLDQKVLQRTQQVNDANNEIKRFAYIVSHDLRSPLVNIKGFSSELKYSIQELQINLLSKEGANQNLLKQILEQDVPESLAFIETSVKKMDKQINAILSLSRMGSRGLTSEPIDMNALVHDQLSLLQHQIEHNHVELEIDDLPILTADRFSMEQIFSNLLGNAIKYLRPDTKGLLKVKFEIKEQSQESKIIFHISDNGRGITEKEQPFIFDIFKRAGEQDTVGEGMGLTYIKALIQRHGGQIWCSSEPGKGSTFSFSIIYLDAKHE